MRKNQRKFTALVSYLISLAVLCGACTANSGVPAAPSTLPVAGGQTPLATATDLSIEESTPTPETVSSPTPTLIPYTSPSWFRDAIMYEIFVRSFADSNRDGVGDIPGIVDKLDYIDALGVNGVWLMPIYQSPSIHGYDVSDFFAVNPAYGTKDDLITLVEAAHARGLRVILDFVPSHLSNQHPYFKDAYKNPDSPYSDWFVWSNKVHTTYAGFAGNQEMPRFNHYNPEVVRFLQEAALYWLDLDSDGDYTDGVDGLRIDNATFPPQEFLIALRQTVKAANPEALLLGETWVHNPADLARFFQDQFDALFDFPMYEVFQGNKDSNGDGLLAGKGLPVLLTSLLAEEGRRYPPEAIPVRFLSNHDTNRIASEVARDPLRMRLAASLLAALPGPVMVYYGEEIGMPGQKGGPPYWDNYRREPMDWYEAAQGPGQATWFIPPDRWNQPSDGISVQEQDNAPDSLLNYYRRVFDLRTAYPAFTQGTMEVLELQVDAPGPWGIKRTADGEDIIALFNFASEERHVVIASFPFTAPALKDLLTGDLLPAVQAGNSFSIDLPPAGVVYLIASP